MVIFDYVDLHHKFESDSFSEEIGVLYMNRVIYSNCKQGYFSTTLSSGRFQIVVFMQVW